MTTCTITGYLKEKPYFHWKFNRISLQTFPSSKKSFHKPKSKREPLNTFSAFQSFVVT